VPALTDELLVRRKQIVDRSPPIIKRFDIIRQA
jgi:hypothetical protein